MLGPVAGGRVRLASLGEDGRLGVTEGSEMALAAMALFGVPVWAALSADGVARFQWPDGVRHVTIFADAGDAGRQAAATLADRLNLADIPSTVVAPLHGDDFNDDLRHGVSASDYAKESADPPPAAPRTFEEMQAAASALTYPVDGDALGRLLGAMVMAELEAIPLRQLLDTIKATTRLSVAVLEKHMRDLRKRLGAGGPPAPRPSWFAMLLRSDDGKPERNEANVVTALSNDEAFAGTLVFDAFGQELLVNRPLPWDDEPLTAPRAWTDVDDVRCAEWLQRREINVTPPLVSRSVRAVARRHTIHPVREYLSSLRWDGTPRLETWAITHIGAADTPLNRTFGARWMISAVARIMEPGAKADHMLILEGSQGLKKSTALRILAGDAWFTDEVPEIGSKDCAQQMSGKWIIELAELDAISRAEASRIKAFLTRTTDRYRPPYERNVIEVPRQCVFAGSVNLETYLRDETGGRRFWPIRCGTRIDLGGLRRDRDQLWAEAVLRYRDGAIWWLDEPELVATAKEEQNARYQGDAWDAKIDRWLTHERRRVNRGYGGYDDLRDEEVERDRPICDVSVGEILEGALDIEPAKWTKGDQMRVGAYLKSRQWERYRKRTEGQLEWRYRRPAWL